jgi:hypothetical protein
MRVIHGPKRVEAHEGILVVEPANVDGLDRFARAKFSHARVTDVFVRILHAKFSHPPTRGVGN